MNTGNNVHEYEAPSVDTDKITYTVPADMELYIQTWHVSVSDGRKYIFELQDDGAGVSSIGNGGGTGGPGDQRRYPEDNPLGPFETGHEITISRVQGDANKDWSCGFVGFLRRV